MDKFYIHGGQFWLNDSPQFIQAGEFHYFRTPKDQWGHRLGLLKEAGFNAVAAYMPWIWHQLEEGVSDFYGRSNPLRDLAGFLDLATEMGLYIIARPGPYIMAETINEGIPPWVFKNYPQTSFISQDGKTQNVASYLHPDFLACAKKWYQSIFSVLAPRQITRGGKIIMVQLDNEMGMIEWVRNILDINPNTISRFANYLEKTYGISRQERYPTENLRDYLREGISNPSGSQGEKIVVDYRRFYREYLHEYATFLLEEARADGLEVPPIVNIHGFMNGGKTFPIGLSQLIKVMDIEGMISATDVYPGAIGEGNFHQLLLLNEITKALQNEQQPLFSVEFQAGGNNDFSGNQSSLFDLHSRLCISSGMRAINHYLFFDGENDPILSPVKRHDWGHPVRKDGTLRKHYARYRQLSSVLRSYGADLILAHPKTTTTIGFFLDHFMTEVNNECSKEAASIITHQREVILFDFIARGLSLTHRPFDALELDRCEINAKKTPLLWVMMERQSDAEIQQKLVDYVKQGGNLVLVGRMCIEDFNHRPCTILKDALGIKEIDGGLPFAPGLIRAFDYDDVPVSFMETYTGAFEKVFATHDKGRQTVGFIKPLGRGRVMVFGAAMSANTLGDLDIVHQMANQMGCPPLFEPSDWVDIRISSGERGSFMYINNYQDDPVEITIKYMGELMFSGNPIRLPARRGLILPVEWKLNKDVTIHYATSEIVEITDSGSTITLRMEQPDFFAEISLSCYSCGDSEMLKKTDSSERIKVHGKEGVLVLRKEG